MAIDRENRAQLRNALTRLVEGSITNHQFNDLSPSWECADRAVRTVGEFFVELCTDEREYRLTGSQALDAGDRAIADRCRLFLQTDLEYGWPEAPSMAAHAAVGGVAIFLILPLGIVLLIAAPVVSEPVLVLPGLACLGLSGLWHWWWSRREAMPEWRAYWANGDREAWPFLRRWEYEQALKSFDLESSKPPG